MRVGALICSTICRDLPHGGSVVLRWCSIVGVPSRAGSFPPVLTARFASRSMDHGLCPRRWAVDHCPLRSVLWIFYPDVRAIVVTGAGERAFCVGADMSASAAARTGLAYWTELDPNGFGGLSLRTTLDVPVIARVNGYALGGGMELVLGCD